MANRDIDSVELVCYGPDGQGSDQFGEIPAPVTATTINPTAENSMLFFTSCSHTATLQRSTSPILMALGKHFSFEIAVGVNGRFFVQTSSPLQTITLGNAIIISEKMNAAEINELVKDLIFKLAK